jgi:long-chain acyl-CoA synthetase
VSNEVTKTLISYVDDLQYVKTIVLYDDKASPELEAALDAKQIALKYFKDLVMTTPIADNPPTPDSIAAFSYTSGTTGEPKGVPLLQRNLLAELSAMGGYGFTMRP